MMDMSVQLLTFRSFGHIMMAVSTRGSWRQLAAGITKHKRRVGMEASSSSDSPADCPSDPASYLERLPP